jgi:HD superfamily phosphohydrolase
MKARVFRDPVHGLIGLEGADAIIGGLLDIRALQRLRRVRQMGFASLVYPGAEHSRFGHALGAMHVAGRVCQALGLDEEVSRDVKVAALLHDVGHGPYSHAWEEALGGGVSHEAWGGRIVAEDDELGAALAAIAPDQGARILALFEKRYTPQLARKLVSSQLDVDRMDYLLRDAHFSGVGYSTYDLGWIVHALRAEPVREGADPDDLVVDYRRGMHAVEQYLFGRSYMYAQVYYHKTVRAAEWLFMLIMRRFGELAREGREPAGLATAAAIARAERVSVAAYLGLDDARVQCALADWAAGAEDDILRDLAARLCARRLFKTLELPDDPAVPARLQPELEAAARAVLGERAPYYWAVDRAVSLGYDTRPGEEIFVVGHPRHGTIDLGQLVAELPLGRKVSTVRLLFARELADAFCRIVAAAT